MPALDADSRDFRQPVFMLNYADAGHGRVACSVRGARVVLCGVLDPAAGTRGRAAANAHSFAQQAAPADAPSIVVMYTARDIALLAASSK
ncbi:hypothetical protein AURDEDRAFT_173737 [Auricularia subglabra TFB-10046 SS5]|uniref:Uncharacterized protein n=1 Tax=Auricularia subglabra (strain TFB-10046 / SS5) TaxID=717982 RepID=J0LH83_AURST|nr:hypothetical protein AURDEDRAFT_173737 [Auricularia subglabra TFB-10046 SS5]